MAPMKEYVFSRQIRQFSKQAKMQSSHGLSFKKVHVTQFGIYFVQVVMQPDPGDFKGSTKGIYIGRELGSVAQGNSRDNFISHHYITHFGVVPYLDCQIFKFTYLRIDENCLQVSRQDGEEWASLPYPIARDTFSGHRAEVIHWNGRGLKHVLLTHLCQRLTRVPLPAYQADLAYLVKASLFRKGTADHIQHGVQI